MGDACAFCERIRVGGPFPGGILLENPHYLATLWTNPQGPTYLGQVLLQTRRHVPSLASLTSAEGAALGPMIQRLSRALGEAVGPELVYLDCYMEVVRHVHLFLTARYPRTPREFWRLDLTDWPDAPRGGLPEVEALADRLRATLSAPTPTD
jgi:histidine triad (HIT) family protein